MDSIDYSRLVSGDVEGRFDQLFSRINSIQKKSGAFDVSISLNDTVVPN